MSNKGDKNSKDNKVEPNERIMARNLSYDTEEGGLTDYFSQFGEVVEAEVARQNNGRSKGYGFVTFKTVEGATKAANQPEHDLDGRTVRANFARKRSQGGRKLPPGKKLYIGNLPWKLNEEEMTSYFEKFGKVEDVFLSVVKYASPVEGYPQHKGFGFVTFVTEEGANKAVNSKEHLLKNNRLSVRKAKPQKGGRKKDQRYKKQGKQVGQEKKKPLVVKRKQGNKKPPATKATSEPKSDNKKQEKQEKQEKPKVKKVQVTKPANKKKSNKGPKIVTSNKNPWKSVDSKDNAKSEGFPSLNKEKKEKKGKGELN